MSKKRRAKYLREYFFRPGGIPAAVMNTIYGQQEEERHSHDFEELVLVSDGSGEHLAPEGNYSLRAGDVFVICEGQRHGYSSTKKLVITNIIYDREAFAHWMSELRDIPGFHALFSLEPANRARQGFGGRLRLRLNELDTVRKMAEQLKSELIEARPGYRAVAKALLVQIAATLSRAYDRAEHGEAVELLRLGGVLSFLETNLERVSVTELAEMAHLSERHFYRIFKQATGETPVQYQLRLRLEQAKKLISSTSLNITEIAFRVGFSDSNYFSRQFRKFTGRRPIDYRQKPANRNR